jgi:hypothetical protein
MNLEVKMRDAKQLVQKSIQRTDERRSRLPPYKVDNGREQES